MLIFTNRLLKAEATDASAFTDAYKTFSDSLNTAQVQPTANGGWLISHAKSKISDSDALKPLFELLKGNKPVLVYLHGNNNTPVDCFTRCQALEHQYDVAVIGFSWASEGYQPDGSDLAGLDMTKMKTDDGEDSLAQVTSKAKLQTEGWITRKARRYGQAKLNAHQSKDALAHFLRLVASARLATMHQKVSLAVHSLGCHFLHYAVFEQDAEASLAAMQNVALIAGCTGASKHAAWVEQIHPMGKVFIAYTKADSVLFAASVVDSDVKLGTDPGSERLPAPKYRYMDFENAKNMKFGAHRYFVADPDGKMSKQAKKLFKRIFSSELDYNPSIEPAKVVYPVGCNADGSICYMGNAAVVGEQ